MRHPDGLTAVLDANVLYPQWLRDVMLTLAAMGHYDPVWSEQILDEMRRNVLRDHPSIDPERFDEVTIAALRRAFPDASTDVPPGLVEQMDNALEDRHVLATAVAADADLVVTINTADFRSPRFVDSSQIAIETPDEFLRTVLTDHPELMTDALSHLATNRHGVDSIDDVLTQLHRHQALHPFVRLARDVLI